MSEKFSSRDNGTRKNWIFRNKKDIRKKNKKKVEYINLGNFNTYSKRIRYSKDQEK